MLFTSSAQGFGLVHFLHTPLYFNSSLSFQINNEELHGIADSPENVFHVSGFNTLFSIRAPVVEGMCRHLQGTIP